MVGNYYKNNNNNNFSVIPQSGSGRCKVKTLYPYFVKVERLFVIDRRLKVKVKESDTSSSNNTKIR